MKIAGAHTLATEPQRAYTTLQDPGVLARCMPGCKHMALIGPDEYEMKMNVVISAVQGLFAGKIRVADQQPPASFRLIVEGTGKVGFLKGDGLLTLVAHDGNSTEVHYAGEVQVGGMIAGVGQRLLDSTARLIIRKFFARMEEQLANPGTDGTFPAPA